MLNQEKWINSLPKSVSEKNREISEIDSQKWIDTIPKKKTLNSFTKYSFLSILFVLGLLTVSVVKNETRILQKKINNLESSINLIKFNLHQAILDNEVITSPENISLLANEYLNDELTFYKRSQIKQLETQSEKISNLNKINEKKKENHSNNTKLIVAKKIEKNKRKLQELYYNPETIPGEIKTQVAVKIEKKKFELKKIYEDPKDIFTLEKAGRWTVIQVVKAFFGMPFVPGR